MKEFFLRIGQKIKDFFINFIFRLKPRWSFRWILTCILWLILLAYIGFGIYVGVEIYRNHSESRLVEFSAKIYPMPAAFVGGNIIGAKDYYQQLGFIRKFSQETKQPNPPPEELRRQIIDQLVENRLLSWEAAKNGLRVTSKDIDDAYQKIVSESGGEANVSKVLRELYGMSNDEFRDLVSQQVTKEKIQDELIAQV